MWHDQGNESLVENVKFYFLVTELWWICNAKNNIKQRIWTLFLPISQKQYGRHPTHSSWSCHIYKLLRQVLTKCAMILSLCREGCRLNNTTSPSIRCLSTMSPYWKIIRANAWFKNSNSWFFYSVSATVKTGYVPLILNYSFLNNQINRLNDFWGEKKTPD